MPTSRVPLIYGAGNFGASELKDVTRIADVTVAQSIIDAFVQKFGYKEIDTSRIYGTGNSEKMLSRLDLHGARVDTKIYPTNPGDHAPSKVREILQQSLDALGDVKIRTLYLHAPDRSVPFEDTVDEIDKLYKEGKFESFGLSNFTSWEVTQIYVYCRERNYILPTIYEGPYSLIARTNEDELFPALRKFNIRFAAYSVLGGGLLKGNPTRPGGRYDPTSVFGNYQIRLYTEGQQLLAIEQLKEIGEKHGLSVGEIALRWIQHHSKLRPTDGVIIGASNLTQLEENIRHSEKGPLPDEVSQAVEDAWLLTKGGAKHYRTGVWPEYEWA